MKKFVTALCIVLAAGVFCADVVAQRRAIGVEQLPKNELLSVNEAASGNSAALFVGVNEFDKDAGLASLSCAANDAVGQVHLFVRELKLIPAENCILYLSGEPSTAIAAKQLELLRKDGVVVTIDAAGCQKKIAEQIVKQGGDYILQLKGNQGGLHDETVMLFEQCLRDDCYGIAYTTAATTNGGHGRIEQRRIWATSEVGWFAQRSKWKKLRSLIRVESKRTIDGKTSCEYRYYISSLPADEPDRLLNYIRGHWSVENSLHWCLDIGFADDDRRIRKGHVAENFARLSRIALNLLKAQTKHNVGIKTKRLCCGWSHDYLFRVLTQDDKGI